MIAITGESGCGKSTLLQLIAGLDQDYEGKILFNQVKIEDIKDYRQLVISFVYQNYQLIDYLSVKDNCLFYCHLKGIKVELEGKTLQIKLSKEMLGRVFNGSGRPIDGLGEISSDIKRNISGKPINPIARKYPRNFIETGISAIDCLMTLIRGQKLPIFSGSGINHNNLTERIIRQANIKDDENFAVVFGLMGAEYETAEFFRKSFKENRSYITCHINNICNTWSNFNCKSRRNNKIYCNHFRSNVWASWFI